MQSAVLFPELSKIKVIASMGGSLHTDIPYCRIPGPRLILGKKTPPPGKAENIVRTYVRNIKPSAVRTQGNVMEMRDFLTCVFQQAYLARWFRANWEEKIDVMTMLERVETLPPSKFMLQMTSKRICNALQIWSPLNSWDVAVGLIALRHRVLRECIANLARDF